jgi:hypothetical protein
MLFEGRILDLQNADDRKIYNRLYMRQYIQDNKEKMKAYRLQYYQDHKASIKGYMKKYNDNITERQKAQKKENAKTRSYIRYNFDDEFRTKKQQLNRDRYKNKPENKKKILEYYKEKYKNNIDGFRDKAIEYSKAYRLDPVAIFFGIGQAKQIDKDVILDLA